MNYLWYDYDMVYVNAIAYPIKSYDVKSNNILVYSFLFNCSVEIIKQINQIDLITLKTRVLNSSPCGKIKW